MFFHGETKIGYILGVGYTLGAWPPYEVEIYMLK